MMTLDDFARLYTDPAAKKLRESLTPEEIAEAERTTALWEDFEHRHGELYDWLIGPPGG